MTTAPRKRSLKRPPVTIKGKTYYNTVPTPAALSELADVAREKGYTLITPDYIRNTGGSILGLAKQIEADFANTRYVLTGRSLPNLSRARRIALALDLSLDDIRFPKELMDNT